MMTCPKCRGHMRGPRYDGTTDHLARHPAGTESMVGSLRSLRRAVAGRGRA